ncbi:uncharacterized protein A4U43_C07F15080 [Asparagus officinalis]|nr:uncharacterized protein A4U43_C07F15080 [Asparagus officinalis]
MAKPLESDDLSEEIPSSDSTESDDDDQKSEEEVEDEEELEVVARPASPDEDDESQSTEDDEGFNEGKSDDDDDDNEAEGTLKASEIGKRERARLRELERLKKQKIQEILDAQNAAIDADMNTKGKGRLQYLLQQTEIFAHFAKGAQSATEKKTRGR